MAGVNEPRSKSEIKNSTVDPATSNIPPGEEHNRCREALANTGAGVNVPNEKGNTPLMLAVCEGYVTKVNHIQCVNELIKAGADVNMKDKNGNTPLNIAAVYGREACLKLLINAGADVNITCDAGETPLITLLFCGDIGNIVKIFLKKGADVNHSDKWGGTPLMVAARCGRISSLNMLLTAGAHVNTRDNDYRDALYWAAFYSQYEAVEILLNLGANVNNRNTQGDNSLLSAVNMDRQRRYNAKEHHSHVKTVNKLIEAGADVNVQNTKGQTALFCAAWWGHVKCMKSLLKAGADVNMTNNNGVTALINSSHYGKHKSVDVLLKAGADVNATDNIGCNALHPCYWLDFHVNIKDLDDLDTALYLPWYHKFESHESRESNPHYIKCVKRLLGARIHINQNTSIYNQNAISSSQHRRSFYRDTVVLLYAAGETLGGTIEEKIPVKLKFEEEKLELKHICREAIREHLLKLDWHANLFSRVPELGLPSIMTEYLLYNQSLDYNDDDDDGN